MVHSIISFAVSKRQQSMAQSDLPKKKNPAPNGIASQKDLIVEQRVIRFFVLENEHYIYHIYSQYNKMNIV